MRPFLASLAAATVMLTPAWGFACPVCATREGSGPMGTLALGALIVAPWIAAAGVGWWIRKGLVEEAALQSQLARVSGDASVDDRS